MATAAAPANAALAGLDLAAPASAPMWAAPAMRRPQEGRRRWTVHCRDLRSRQALVVIQVDLTGAVCLHIASAAVLTPSDVRRLQRRLGDALARALADGAEYPDGRDDEQPFEV